MKYCSVVLAAGWDERGFNVYSLVSSHSTDIHSYPTDRSPIFNLFPCVNGPCVDFIN